MANERAFEKHTHRTPHTDTLTYKVSSNETNKKRNRHRGVDVRRRRERRVFGAKVNASDIHIYLLCTGCWLETPPKRGASFKVRASEHASDLSLTHCSLLAVLCVFNGCSGGKRNGSICYFITYSTYTRRVLALASYIVVLLLAILECQCVVGAPSVTHYRIGRATSNSTAPVEGKPIHRSSSSNHSSSSSEMMIA